MRSSSILAASFAASSLSGLMLLTPAIAGPASTWVDPPAKTDGVKADETKPAVAAPEPAKARAEGTPDASEAANRHSARRTTRAERRDRRLARREGASPIAAPSEISTSPDPRFTDWAAQAQRLAADYLGSVSSSSEAMLASAPHFYGSRVRFHGRVTSLTALIAEKRRFVRRWPERRYQPQAGATRIACNVASTSCTLRTVIDFRAENPARGARSQGLSELALTISFAGERPVIVSESSRVLRRGNVALGPGARGDGA
ncbi:hypothetical protein [Methylobacterium gnaphalii]|uniref:DUF4440 domain-containing protein n=1 Tax=Methylobacterium gnaphalii TaxID=1010610 RepID=A0A512JIB5_9HYPH|nr:hypothetical protein [Methylobacterium gnaphalii]GEP09663.1 hypothetical protein MGN01_15080 [Methylobacterium gnaphalii]GJD67750.1 hypothetical protein MMMDOFMJ_0666 [Methylobacterium gnaphalii]GLS50081.1 hypothetical protein GCM10007885_29330 [Methylobacterium gnaphalii]